MRTPEQFQAVLTAEGPAAALAYLNQGVAHRYSAIYRFDGELLRNVLLCDKREQVRPDFLLVVPFRHSFCQFVLRDQAFRTEDSRQDPRLADHPYRGVVISYHSVPLVDEQGALWGTLSHFDMHSHPLADEEFRLMERAAPVFGRNLALLEP
ncbi:GAF domain-containing protein [Variovorax sp. OV329]|uniref:GAF domain-containing protein n=1 Tax=Variovorax sp. OV329 TaxID=1882825 RepID=UPI0008EA4C89|nr:GAF domain-containing protein [Variovorax sp. OV329]SFM64148.1 GAF domain-containing protein [Variovorax sp. OV329]